LLLSVFELCENN